jgi:CRP-like cAMP-binding protein
MNDKSDTKKIRETIAENSFFAGMDGQYLDFLAGTARYMKAEKGEILFRQGQPAKTFYLALNGQVAVEVAAIQGPGLQLQALGAGQMLGWSWLIEPYRWDFQARVTEEADMIEFDGRAVLAQCEKDKAFGYQLYKRFTYLMSERLGSARRKMMDQWEVPGFA